MKLEDDIKNSLKVLQNGGVILYPTDTVWGLGCDATNREAVEKIFKIKDRKANRSLIILVNGEPMLKKYISEIPPVASALLDITDSPLTIIYPEGRNLANGITAEDGSVGIRITGDRFCIELIERFGKPLVSTSANKSKEPAPSFFCEISPYILNSVDYVVYHRREDRQKHKASPVIKVETNGEIKILRK
jgi:L-threonylcarbamoyladenylate synthase